MRTSSPQICVKAVNLLEKESSYKAKQYIDNQAYNAGVMFYVQGWYEDAYKYWKKASKLGHRKAGNNLQILCKENPWLCR